MLVGVIQLREAAQTGKVISCEKHCAAAADQGQRTWARPWSAPPQSLTVVNPRSAMDSRVAAARTATRDSGRRVRSAGSAAQAAGGAREEWRDRGKHGRARPVPARRQVTCDVDVGIAETRHKHEAGAVDRRAAGGCAFAPCGRLHQPLDRARRRVDHDGPQTGEVREHPRAQHLAVQESQPDVTGAPEVALESALAAQLREQRVQVPVLRRPVHRRDAVDVHRFPRYVSWGAASPAGSEGGLLTCLTGAAPRFLTRRARPHQHPGQRAALTCNCLAAVTTAAFVAGPSLRLWQFPWDGALGRARVVAGAWAVRW